MFVIFFFSIITAKFPDTHRLFVGEDSTVHYLAILNADDPDMFILIHVDEQNDTAVSWTVSDFKVDSISSRCSGMSPRFSTPPLPPPPPPLLLLVLLLLYFSFFPSSSSSTPPPPLPLLLSLLALLLFLLLLLSSPIFSAFKSLWWMVGMRIVLGLKTLLKAPF